MAHGLVVGDARERSRQCNSGGGKGGGKELLDDSEDRFAAREAHLEVDLGELELPVGALILIAETAGDLEVAIEAADHEDLLEDLRRLRQRVELARVDAAGNEKIAGALGRGLCEDGRLDFEESLRTEALADCARDFMTQPEVALHLDATQVDVAVFQADFFILDGFFRW